MVMEGINWEEVSDQGKSILSSIIKLSGYVIKYYGDFVEEMSYYWASGNAKLFGDYIQGDMNEFHQYKEDMREEVKTLIEHAAQIYASAFNVSNQISLDMVLIGPAPGSDAIPNPFQETIKGVTGMNKNAVDDCYGRLKTRVETLIEEVKKEIESVQLSIFDIANAQRIAFELKMKSLYSAIEGYLATTLQDIEKYKAEEQDRITLAKQQTVSTFSA